MLQLRIHFSYFWIIGCTSEKREFGTTSIREEIIHYEKRKRSSRYVYFTIGMGGGSGDQGGARGGTEHTNYTL